MTMEECLAEMTDEQRERVLKQAEQPEWLIEGKISFSEKELRWIISTVPSTFEELLDAKIAQMRISLKQYVSETKWAVGRAPDDWIEFLKQEKANRR